MKRSSETTLLVLSYFSAICIGLFDGLLGVAWPTMRGTLGASLDAVGLLFVAATAGFLLSSVVSGRLITQGGLGRFLLASAALKFVGIVGFALLPGLPGIIAASFVAGIGTGGLDTGTNTYVASNHSAGRMNWLHAGYGIGVTVGPLLMTGILRYGLMWRWGYAITSVFELMLVVGVLLTLGSWQIRSAGGGEPSAGQVPMRDTLRIPAVWLGIAIFLLYTGAEVSTGQWTYTLFTEGRAIDQTTAGLWVSIYWGTFTVGRLAMGFVADRISQTRLLRGALIGAAAGAALLWLNPHNPLQFAGVGLIGLCFAPVFPTLVFTTSQRLGSRHAPNAIGFQIASASLGSAIMPGLAGVLAQRTSLEVIGPFVLVGILLMCGLHEGLVAWTRRQAAAGS